MLSCDAAVVGEQNALRNVRFFSSFSWKPDSFGPSSAVWWCGDVCDWPSEIRVPRDVNDETRSTHSPLMQMSGSSLSSSLQESVNCSFVFPEFRNRLFAELHLTSFCTAPPWADLSPWEINLIMVMSSANFMMMFELRALTKLWVNSEYKIDTALRGADVQCYGRWGLWT